MHTPLKILFTFSIFFYCSISFAQNIFQKWYTGYGNEYGNEVQQTFDGGYIIIGTTGGSPPTDLYLIKTNSDGDSIWSKFYGGAGYDWGYSVKQTTDSGYIICGSYDVGSMIYDVYLIKTDSNGDTLWTRKWGGTNKDEGFCVQQTSDGGYVVAGRTESFGQSSAGNPNAYVIKTDSNGNMQWDTNYGGTQYSVGRSILQTNDGGYIMTGSTFVSVSPPNGQLYLVKTDMNGIQQWDTIYGGSNGESGTSIKQTTDSGFIIVGITQSFGAGSNDVYLVKTDSVGNLKWYKTYGGANSDIAYSVQQTIDGGYIIAGTTYSFNVGSPWNMWLIRTDSVGNSKWSRVFGMGSGGCDGNSVCLTTDGGFAAVGSIELTGAGDVYLVKTDSSGNPGLPTSLPEDFYDFNNSLVCIYPNPFTISATFLLSENIYLTAKNFQLEVYNLYGQKIRSVEMDERQVTLQRENLVNGIYLYQLKKNNYVITAGKIIVQ